MGWLKERQRRRIRRREFPSLWWEIIARNAPLLSRLTASDRRELEGKIQIFLVEKHFEGAGSLEMTDEVRVTITAQACLLLLHRNTDYYPRLVSIIVYPHPYLAPRREQDHAGVITEMMEPRAGESWSRGALVLSWDDIKANAAGTTPGRNVILHEFTHQLDSETGATDGIPLLPPSLRDEWVRTLQEEYACLQQEVARGRESVLDPYAATSPAEFFAVATEAFFEQPFALRDRLPRLYDVLRRYYRQDPVQTGESITL
ncbi:MAG: zinc-dependent peptidase [Planctomycetes bacterium]|nr:zinc-dependent peptidase [Planctomycetota bacterium]